MDGEKALGRLALQPHDLPLRRQPAGQAIERDIVDLEGKEFFV